MKKWLQIVHKYVFQVSVGVFGVLFIYSLIFSTPVATLVRVLVSSGGLPIKDRVPDAINALAPNALALVNQNETIGRSLMYLSIVGLILCGINIVYRSHIRKKYYLTNKIVVGIWVVFTLGCAIFMLATIIPFMIDFMNLPFEAINEIVITREYTPLDSGAIGYYIFGILLAIVLLVFFAGVLTLFIQKIKESMSSKEEESTNVEVKVENSELNEEVK